jgi:pyrrolysyl-tRNA synthetase-like protein
MDGDKPPKVPPPRYYRKRVELFRLIEKIKLWPSRRGVLHGIRSVEVNGDMARLETHCGRTFLARNSRNSRAARWLRNKWFTAVCSDCSVPEWKLEKYAATRFRRHQGSVLRGGGVHRNRACPDPNLMFQLDYGCPPPTGFKRGIRE